MDSLEALVEMDSSTDPLGQEDALASTLSRLRFGFVQSLLARKVGCQCRMSYIWGTDEVGDPGAVVRQSLGESFLIELEPGMYGNSGASG